MHSDILFRLLVKLSSNIKKSYRKVKNKVVTGLLYYSIFTLWNLMIHCQRYEDKSSRD